MKFKKQLCINMKICRAPKASACVVYPLHTKLALKQSLEIMLDRFIRNQFSSILTVPF